MKCLPIALLVLGLATSAAVAQSGEPAVEAPGGTAAAGDASGDTSENGEIVVEGEVAKERRRVCEMQTTTGSIMPKRVCRTVAQIEEDQRNAQESLGIISRDRDSRSFTQASREAAR